MRNEAGTHTSTTALPLAVAEVLLEATHRIAACAGDRFAEAQARLDDVAGRRGWGSIPSAYRHAVESAKSTMLVAETAYASARLAHSLAYVAHEEAQRELDALWASVDQQMAEDRAALEEWDAQLRAEQERYGVDVADYAGGLFPVPA